MNEYEQNLIAFTIAQQWIRILLNRKMITQKEADDIEESYLNEYFPDYAASSYI